MISIILLAKFKTCQIDGSRKSSVKEKKGKKKTCTYLCKIVAKIQTRNM